MPDTFSDRFTEAEMAAIRSALRDEQNPHYKKNTDYKNLGKKLFALLAKFAGQLPFSEDILAAWHCARDPATPARVRYVLIMALGYFVLPFDAVPDFLPLLGFTDDAAVIAAAIATVAGAITPVHRAKAKEWLNTTEKPR